MKTRNVLIVAACLIVCSGLASAEPRTYRQFKDVALKEKGQVVQSSDNKNLFECTYAVDAERKTITRTKIRRLDDPVGRADATVYTVTQKKVLPGSEAGNGGKVLIAVSQDGTEILELGHRFAFTMRTSPFALVISGVYKRVYDRPPGSHRPDQPKP